MKAQETTAVATQTEQVPMVSETASVMQMIAQAARDPNVDIDKMERLLALHERMTNKKAEADFNDALSSCQKEAGTIQADATNPQTRSKYLTYAGLDKRLRPIYTKRDISISYGTEDTDKPDTVRVIAHVSRGAYTRIYRVDMPADGKGAKGGDVMTKTHATGAAMSYGARYLLKGIFNISIGEEDTDGNDPNKARAMSDSARADFEVAIEALTDIEAWDALWKKILAANADVLTHEALRSKMAAKKRGLTK